MLLKNFFKARDIVSPIPIGVDLVLEYDAKGKLHKIYSGEDKEVFASKELTQALQNSNVIPKTIHVRGGVTNVFGMLYTKQRYLADGALPACVEDQMVADFILKPNKFKFIAGYMKNSNQNLMGTAVMAQTLKMAGFTVLPYLLITEPLTEEHMKRIVTERAFPYNYPLITGYYIYRNGEVFRISTDLMQGNIASDADAIVSKFTARGDLRATITLDDGKKIECTYTDLTHLNIHPNSLITYEESTNKIIDSYLFEEYLAPQRPDKISCPDCGRLIKIPESGLTMCSDPHCPSRVYQPIVHFLQKLNLPMITFEQFEALRVVDKNVKSIETLLKTSLYANTHVRVSLHKFLASMIPELSDDDCLKIVELCKHSKDTLVYYMQNPDKVKPDLHVQGIWVNKFIKWCTDTKNVDEFTNLLYSDCIEIAENTPLFKGAPMFRNNKIAITGTFKHGSLSAVSDILKSYSAEVTTQYEPTLSLVIIGDIEEDVNGLLVTKAKASGIQVCRESEFFKMYNIDEDLKNIL